MIRLTRMMKELEQLNLQEKKKTRSHTHTHPRTHTHIYTKSTMEIAGDKKNTCIDYYGNGTFQFQPIIHIFGTAVSDIYLYFLLHTFHSRIFLNVNSYMRTIQTNSYQRIISTVNKLRFKNISI